MICRGKITLYIVCFGPYYDQLIQVQSAKNDILHLLCFEAFFLLCIIPKPIMEIPRFSEKDTIHGMTDIRHFLSTPGIVTKGVKQA